MAERENTAQNRTCIYLQFISCINTTSPYNPNINVNVYVCVWWGVCIAEYYISVFVLNIHTAISHVSFGQP